jgi:hypothetical protein
MAVVGCGGGFGAGGDAEFGQDSGYVYACGVAADEEFRGDLSVAEALGDEA